MSYCSRRSDTLPDLSISTPRRCTPPYPIKTRILLFSVARSDSQGYQMHPDGVIDGKAALALIITSDTRREVIAPVS